MLVRAVRTHTSPEGHYRNEGDKFDHTGELYRHIEETEATVPEKPYAEKPEKPKPHKPEKPKPQKPQPSTETPENAS